MSNRIYWNDSEKNMLINGVASLMKSQPGLTLVAALNRVQKQLPENRRRHINAITAVPWLKKKVEEIVKQQSVDTKLKIVEKTINLGIDSIPTEDLITELFNRLARNTIREAIHNSIAQIMSKLPAKEVQHEQNNLHRVAIVGLEPEQRNTISKLFSSEFDIKFVEGKGNISKDSCRNRDVILMTKFISHSDQNIAKSVANSILYCNGGVSALEDILMEMIK